MFDRGLWFLLQPVGSTEGKGHRNVDRVLWFLLAGGEEDGFGRMLWFLLESAKTTEQRGTWEFYTRL